MKAAVIDKITPAKDAALTEIPIPEGKPGWVLVKVKAFGLNHSEQILRQEEIQEDYIQKPVIPGIECVGMVADPGFRKGQKVCALMGGMGRSFHGSYAQSILQRVNGAFHTGAAVVNQCKRRIIHGNARVEPQIFVERDINAAPIF